MKKSRLLLIFISASLVLTGCNTKKSNKKSKSSSIPTTSEKSSSGSSKSSGGSTSSSGSTSTSQSTSSSGSSSTSVTPPEEQVIDNMYLNKQTIDLIVGKTDNSLFVYFSPEDVDSSYKEGYWESSNTGVVSVSAYGVLTGVSAGEAVVSYVTTKEAHVASCTVYVYNSSSDIHKEYVKVTDADSIKAGDIIMFGCPEFNVAASLDKVSGYVKTTSASFSSDGNTLLSPSADVASYYVGNGKNGGLTLETQANTYLMGKSTAGGNDLSYLDNTKGQIEWIFEIPSGYSKIFCVNFNIEQDLWVMFNKISNDDIRMRIYDSNETELLKLPTIYRLTVIR